MSLINKLPHFYLNGVTKPIQDAITLESDGVINNTEDTLNQFFVESATWGLDKWEKMLGIPKNTLDYVTRRENIKAKMRARGTSSIKTIKNICEAYSYGEVDIIVNHEDYSFEVHFVGSIGVPKAFAELDKTIEEIKPAHLACSYKFNYNTNFNISNYTHEQLSNYTHTKIRNSTELRGDK